MTAIKVAHITTVDLSLRYLLLNQLKSIQQAGYLVYGISAPGSAVPTLQAAGINFIPMPMVRASHLTPLSDLKAFWHLYRVMRRERFTIVHTHTAKADLYGTLAARLAGIPIVVTTLHGFYFHDLMPRHWRRFYITLARIGARCADVLLSQNSEDIQTARREGICPPEKIKHLGNGIDLKWFDRARLDAEALAARRREFGLPHNAPVVGFVGRLVRDKGIVELLQAARIIREQMPDVRFLIVGMIDHAKHDVVTPADAAACGVADICIFTGHREDMPELYALMDVFVLPSHREAFPRTPMEASAMGVPSIVTDVRGCRTTVEEGRNGFRVPLGDVTALAQGILHLLSHPEQAQRMGEEGRRIAVERFDERRVFEKVKAEYARLLQDKGIAVPVPESGQPLRLPAQGYDMRIDTRLVQDERIAQVIAESKEEIPWRRKHVQRLLKRAFDIVVALSLLVILLPVIVLTGILVWLTSEGPVLLAQARVGLDGVPFRMFKFRTMAAELPDGSAKGGGEVSGSDKRLTPIGGWLRGWRLDELPQLLHVLSGKMSLVGPRPDVPANLYLYSPGQMLRFAMPPGCTAWTFTRGAFANDWSKRQDINVEYVRQWSFGLDLKILVGSLVVLLIQKNTTPESGSAQHSDERAMSIMKLSQNPTNPRCHAEQSEASHCDLKQQDSSLRSE